MTYYELQQRVWQNKVRRFFNTSSVEKEIVLMSEEQGELCDAFLKTDRPGVVDAVGDLMVYCLGLCGMFEADADEINKQVEQPKSPYDCVLYICAEVGMLAKTYKHSNQSSVRAIDKREEFAMHIGRLMGFCSSMFKFINANEMQVLEQIIAANETRTHQGHL